MELNKIYNMDNLELLKQLPSESIDLIYCDILYNTGKKFKDYNDNLGTPQQAIGWYKPRLIEMRRVLKDTGSIYLQCDYRLVHYLKVEMDNIFGVNNFRNEIIWHYQNFYKAKTFKTVHDNILYYSKTLKYVYNPQYLYPDNPDRYNREDDIGKYFTNGRGDKCYYGKNLKCPDVWSYLKEKEFHVLNSQAKERVGYDTQKPKFLLERIIKTSSNEDDVVADFFCGSGTSLVVAKELGRNYIGCDINPRAVEITNQRLEEVNGN